MKWLWGGICLLLLMGGPTMAALADDPTATYTPTPRATQYNSGCGLPFNPCGALPFSVPRFPTVALPSPSAIPTLPSPTPVPATMTPSATLTPTETLTPSNTPAGTTATPTAEIQDGGQGFATLASDMGQIAGTLRASGETISIDGTPTGPEELAGKVGEYTGVLFGIMQAFSGMNSFTYGLMAFLLLILAFRLTVIVSTTIGPILLGILKWVLALWQSIKPSWL